MATDPQTSTTSTESSSTSFGTSGMVPTTVSISDTQTLQITQHRLNGTNYRESSQSVILVFRGKGKMGYLDGSIPRPPVTAAGYNQWIAENSIVMSWLINSTEPGIGRTYLYYQTAKEIWEGVKRMYSDVENTTQCFEVRSAIHSTK